MRLFEVFTSVEGEGILYGTKTLFVRLAGCPFACFYCDTKESLPADSGKEYSVEEAAALIDSSLRPNTYKVNFTGGDPLVQHEAVAELARHVQGRGIPTYLESSCFDADRFAHVLPYIDIAKVEFKTLDSEFVDARHHGRLAGQAARCLVESVRAGRTTYVKVVVSARTRPGDFGELAGRILDSVPAGGIDGFVIQPAYGVEEPPLDLLLELYDIVYPRYPAVKVVPQLHKLIGAP